MTSHPIQRYSYGAQHLARSPVSLHELEDLKRAVGFGPQSEHDLHELWGLLADRTDQLVAAWIDRILPFVLPTFTGPDGVADQRYLRAVLSRFIKWIEDTCTRRYDQAWLDYQHEIALRHHRAKKNQTDTVESAAIVPFRYLPITTFVLIDTLVPFLTQAGVDRVVAERLADAWTRSLTIQLALWSQPYVVKGDW